MTIQFTGEISRFDLLSFAIRIPTTALVGYYGPNLTLTFSVNGTGVPSKNPWFNMYILNICIYVGS